MLCVLLFVLFDSYFFICNGYQICYDILIEALGMSWKDKKECHGLGDQTSWGRPELPFSPCIFNGIFNGID